MKQITNALLMVRPVAFRMNEQTAVNNYFQEEIDLKNEEINRQAQQEFDALVQKLTAVGVRVVEVSDIAQQNTPDSIFPNNWVSFHQNGNVALYPMFAPNRRAERREDILETLEEKGFSIEFVYDYTEAEQEGVFLEGTGSMILDRPHEIAYCALSPRSNEDLFIEFCEDFEFTPVVFEAFQTVDGKRQPIYHTNVMMALGENFAVICLDAIDDKSQRKNVTEHLKKSGKEIIAISEEQMAQFAGNILQVQGANSSYIVMSQAAYNAFTPEQRQRLEAHAPILFSDLQTIETCGGGSARCMLAEIFLPWQA